MKRVFGCHVPSEHFRYDRKTGNTYKEPGRALSLWYDSTFAIIDKEVSDDQCKEMADIPGIWKVISKKLDKNGRDFYICAPEKLLPELQNYDDRCVMMIFFIPFDHFCLSDEENRMFYRVARQNHIDLNMPQQEIANCIIQMVVDGRLDINTLLRQARTKVESTPETACLVLDDSHVFDMAIIGEKKVIRFVDVNNENCSICISAENIDEWKNAIPASLNIKKCGNNLYLDVNTTNVEFQILPDVIETLQASGYLKGRFSEKGRPNDLHWFRCERSSPSFQKLLDAVGLCEHEGQYVPKDFCDWKLYFGPTLRCGEIRNIPIREQVKVSFVNGIKACYPAAYLAKKYPGNACGMKVSVAGCTLETLSLCIEGI